MSYDVYVTRTRAIFSEDEVPLPRSEVTAVLAGRGDARPLTESTWEWTPGGFMVSVTDTAVSIANPDDRAILWLIEVAAALGARVVDDEGNLFAAMEDGQGYRIWEGPFGVDLGPPPDTPPPGADEVRVGPAESEESAGQGPRPSPRRWEQAPVLFPSTSGAPLPDRVVLPSRRGPRVPPSAWVLLGVFAFSIVYTLGGWVWGRIAGEPEPVPLLGGYSADHRYELEAVVGDGPGGFVLEAVEERTGARAPEAAVTRFDGKVALGERLVASCWFDRAAAVERCRRVQPD